jgi:hypothetical protein
MFVSEMLSHCCSNVVKKVYSQRRIFSHIGWKVFPGVGNSNIRVTTPGGGGGGQWCLDCHGERWGEGALCPPFHYIYISVDVNKASAVRFSASTSGVWIGSALSNNITVPLVSNRLENQDRKQSSLSVLFTRQQKKVKHRLYLEIKDVLSDCTFSGKKTQLQFS